MESFQFGPRDQQIPGSRVSRSQPPWKSRIDLRGKKFQQVEVEHFDSLQAKNIIGSVNQIIL